MSLCPTIYNAKYFLKLKQHFLRLKLMKFGMRIGKVSMLMPITYFFGLKIISTEIISIL